VTRRSRGPFYFPLVLEAWQVQTQRPLDETVCRVWGGNGAMRRCVIKGAVSELAIDLVEMRLVPQRFERGCRLPAHGTFTVDAGSEEASHVLDELARSREAVVLERPDRGAIEMRLGGLATTRSTPPGNGSAPRSTVTYSWHAP
jgi:hypothetical protein